MASHKSVLITGVTGYLGSHIAKLLHTTYPHVKIIGTTRSLKNVKRVQQFKEAVSEKVLLVEAEMAEGKECFTKGGILDKVDYVFHTAAPFFSQTKLKECDEGTKHYIEATQALVEGAIKSKVKKVVLTGSASSVIGCFPVKEKGFIYNDPMVWADPKAMNRPNEKAKLLAEKVCWNAIKKQDAQTGDKTTLVTLLPYLMIGPPLYQDLVQTNSSCAAITSIITSAQYGLPQIQLPIVDVRDVALAHLQSVALDNLRVSNGRYLVSSASLWFSEILETLKAEQKTLGIKIKTRILGNFTLQIARLNYPEIKHIIPFLNTELKIDGIPFERDFGLTNRDVKNSLHEMAAQIIKLRN